MIATLVLLATATPTLSLPKPATRPSTWMIPDDYPRSALKIWERGNVSFRLLVSPLGSPISCKAFSSSPTFRRAACTGLMKRARFFPAVDKEGNPQYGIYDAVMTFVLPGTGRSPIPDMVNVVLTVAQLPEGLKSPAYVHLTYLLKADGSVEGCAADDKDPAVQLGEVACREAFTIHRPTVQNDENGKPVDAVDCLRVRFQLPTDKPLPAS